MEAATGESMTDRSHMADVDTETMEQEKNSLQHGGVETRGPQ